MICHEGAVPREREVSLVPVSEANGIDLLKILLTCHNDRDICGIVRCIELSRKYYNKVWFV